VTTRRAGSATADPQAIGLIIHPAPFLALVTELLGVYVGATPHVREVNQTLGAEPIVELTSRLPPWHVMVEALSDRGLVESVKVTRREGGRVIGPFPSAGIRSACLVVAALFASGFSLAGPAGAQADTSWQPAPAVVVHAVTAIPTSVFNGVGLQPGVKPPVVLHKQAALKFNRKPGVYYLGAEPCPLCAAERWAFIAATARFGKWSNLGIAQSAADDVYPNTQTFTFAHSTFSSPYIAVRTVERLSSRQLANGNFAELQQPTTQEAALASRYDTAAYFPANAGSLPFLDIANKFVIAGPSYDPAVLAGLSREQIAADLTDPTKPTTQAIAATANNLAASICAIDGRRPASVCKSVGVTRAGHFSAVGTGTGGSCSALPNRQSTCGVAKSPTSG